MFYWFPSKIELNISLIIIIIIIMIAGGISYIYYRKTIPPLTRNWQIFFGIMRGLIIALIIMLFFAPEMNILWDKTVKKKVIFLIDRSASMQIVEKNMSRITRANQITTNILNKIKNHTAPLMYAFDIDTVKLMRADFVSRDLGTDIEGALKKILTKEEDTSALILLSDGIFTRGDNPIYTPNLLKHKIYTIGIGNTNEIADLAIHSVKINKILYQNNPATVEVELSARGLSTISSVFLKQNGRVIEAKKVNLKADGSVIPLSFTFTPEKLGLVQYTIEIEKHDQEEIIENNSYRTSVEVLKEKVHIALFSSKPNYDIKFIQQLVKQRKDIKINTSIIRTGFYRFLSGFKTSLDSADILILCNYPDLNISEQHQRELMEKIKYYNMPVLLIIGEPLFRRQLSFITNIFPVLSLQSSGIPVLTQVQISHESSLSSILRIYEREEDNKKFWMKCPPIEYIFSKVEFDNGCRVLLETGGLTKNQPVLIAYQEKGKKRLLLLGAGFWRWKFQLAEDEQFKDGWEWILYNMIRWLASGSIYDNIIVSSQKKNYQIGETVNLDIQVYDGSYNPVLDALLRLKVLTEEDTFEIESENSGNGTYRAKLVPLKQGEYQISATAWKNDINLGEGKFNLIATPVNNEFLNTRQDKQFLEKLADRTGGKYFPEENYQDLLNWLDISPQIKRSGKTIELWNRLALLLILIGLLSLEWYLRKRKELA